MIHRLCAKMIEVSVNEVINVDYQDLLGHKGRINMTSEVSS